MATLEEISQKTKAELIEERDTLQRKLTALEESYRVAMLAKNSLQKSQKMLNSILDNTSAVIYVKDIEGRYLLINERFETLFNISKEEI